MPLPLAACDNISESERYGKDPVEVQKAKNVLIEGFTGLKCINCRKLHDVIHGGCKVLRRRSSPLPFTVCLSLPENESEGFGHGAGKAYHEHWNVTTWPKGKIDRGRTGVHSGVLKKRLQMKDRDLDYPARLTTQHHAS